MLVMLVHNTTMYFWWFNLHFLPNPSDPLVGSAIEKDAFPSWKPLFIGDFPASHVWLPEGNSTILPWLSHDYPYSIQTYIYICLLSLLLSYYYPIIIPLLSYYYPIIIPLLSHYYPIIIPLLSHYYPMIIPWLSHYYPIIILLSSLLSYYNICHVSLFFHGKSSHFPTVFLSPFAVRIILPVRRWWHRHSPPHWHRRRRGWASGNPCG